MELLGPNDTSSPPSHVYPSALQPANENFDNYPPPSMENQRRSGSGERSRIASMNGAFLKLRSLIPTKPKDRKLSKIETLRLATSYIAHLNAILVTGLSAAEQPCLRRLPPVEGQRPSVCTFCANELQRERNEQRQ